MTRTDAKPSEKNLTVTYTYIVTMYIVISETVEILILAIEMEFMKKKLKKTPKFSVGRGYRIKHIKM